MGIRPVAKEIWYLYSQRDSMGQSSVSLPTYASESVLLALCTFYFEIHLVEYTPRSPAISL